MKRACAPVLTGCILFFEGSATHLTKGACVPVSAVRIMRNVVQSWELLKEFLFVSTRSPSSGPNFCIKPCSFDQHSDLSAAIRIGTSLLYGSCFWYLLSRFQLGVLCLALNDVCWRKDGMEELVNFLVAVIATLGLVRSRA